MHQFILEPYAGPASRYDCPACNKRKTLSRYINAETNEHLAPHVGRCSRESKCGYHYKPKQYFEGNGLSSAATRKTVRLKAPPKPTVSHLSAKLLQQSLKNYEHNNFIAWCIGLFGEVITSELISRYFIGTSKYWNGATVFWQIDQRGVIKTGKVMLYNAGNGKRVKEPFNHIHWVHKLVGSTQLAVGSQPGFNLNQCFFGEHLLLSEPSKPVAIVESEKSAIIASVYLPQFIWLASGSVSNLNTEKCRVLKGRNVTLFPDLNCYAKWSGIAQKLSFKISRLLESNANDAERLEGLDVADYLLKFPLSDFVLVKKMKSKKLNLADFGTPRSAIKGPEPLLKKPVWDKEIEELELYFKTADLPVHPVKLDHCTTITDVPCFVDGHLANVKRNNGNLTFLPYLERLRNLQGLLQHCHC